MRFAKTLFASALLFAVVGGCTDVPEDTDVWEPKGIMKGTVTYMGPLPCSEGGHVRGNAILTLFNVNSLPPPTGLGLSAHRLAVVPGDVLFAGVAHMIPKNEDGSLACVENPPMVHVSAEWDVGPVDAGRYQIRGWFDYDGDWHAAFKFANMVTLGDVGGGAIANIDVALAGGPVVYSEIEVGIRGEGDVYTIPEDGFVARNVSPILASRIPTTRPYFHISNMKRGDSPDIVPNPTDEDIQMPADYQIADVNPTRVHESLYWFELAAGLPAGEQEPAKAPPFYFELEEQGHTLTLLRYDANKDGVVDEKDRVTGSTVPALGPIVSMTKLDVENDIQKLWRSTQNQPRVLTSLIVAPPDAVSLVELLGYLNAPPTPVASIKAYARPSAVCIEDATNRDSRTIIVTPHQTDGTGSAIIDEDATEQDIADQLSRNPDTTDIAYTCLPPGRYAINVIDPRFGQAWTLPNESGLCMPGETPTNGMCGKRAKLESQFRTFEIGPATDPEYCRAQRGAENADLVREYCLTPSEQQRWDDGTLWD